MRSTLQNPTLLISLLTVWFAAMLLPGCDDDNERDTVPTVSTGMVTAITGTTATVSGEILDNGGQEVTASGFVYSSTNAMPTLQDSFTEETATDGVFTSQLDGLTSTTTYYVRAYAINRNGTGYGETVDFTTDNAAPVATNVSISGDAAVGNVLTGTYTYTDQDNDAESGTTFQWYVADDGTGAGETAIAGATETTYTIEDTQQGKYIRFGVTPGAATGNTTGEEAKSAFVGAVGEAPTVTFTYNGQEVTYGIINSRATGRQWLDRNLGAPNVPSAYDDYANYGDLFQWGRLADGHQLITRSGPNDADMTPVNGTTSTTEPYETSSTDNPGHSLFIVAPNAPSDWRIEQNNNLWQGVDGINNPCPTGWRIATAAEWAEENLGTIADAYTKLKITLTGIRAGDSGLIFQSTTFGRYWTSTVDATDPTLTVRTSINSTGTTQNGIFRNNGYACRCIKD